MPTYVVLSPEKSDEVEKRLKKAYPITSRSWGPGIFFLQSKDSPDQVGDKIGIARNVNGNIVSGDLSGVLVLTIGKPVWGASTQETWDWIFAAFEGEQ